MYLSIKDILNFPSLQEGKVVTKNNTLNHSVTNAIIMEALDIENWGESGQVLLTSYYAFKNANNQEVDSFFKKAKKIGIVGFIFKRDRLISAIPDFFIQKCEEFDLPLIEIPKHVTYPDIIKDILSAIISKNTFLLEFYYENHQKFIQLMMKQADLELVLKTLKDIIRLPVTLIENVENQRISTDSEYHSFTEIKEISTNNERMLHYKSVLVQYENAMNEKMVLSFSIPNLGYENYELIIHTLGHSLSDLQLMAVESAVVALQTEFVQRFALRQNNHSRLNETASELIFGRLDNKESIEDIARSLKLDTSASYRVINFSVEKESQNCSSTELNRFTDKVGNLSRIFFNRSVYIKQPHKIILIVSADSDNLQSIKNKLLNMLNKLTPNELNAKPKISFVTISHPHSVYELSKAYKQAMDLRPLGDLWQNESSIIAYDDIGIFKLFVETENLNSLEQFVPENIWKLQDENPELLNTLAAFIRLNQNYSETAKHLYVHPKTVRYRVNQLAEHYHVQFDDPDKILHYNIALRILKFIDYKIQK